MPVPGTPGTESVALSLVALITAGGIDIGVEHGRQAALERTPSYRYGVKIMGDVVENRAGTGNARRDCRAAVTEQPAPFPGYSASKALAGCIVYDPPWSGVGVHGRGMPWSQRFSPSRRPSSRSLSEDTSRPQPRWR